MIAYKVETKATLYEETFWENERYFSSKEDAVNCLKDLANKSEGKVDYTFDEDGVVNGFRGESPEGEWLWGEIRAIVIE